MTQDRQQRLLEILRQLPESEAGSLLDFAEFLLARSPQNALLQALSEAAAMKQEAATPEAVTLPAAAPASAESAGTVERPAAIPRPETETVIGAVKRLSETYPMLNKDTMLHETADLVGQSLMGTRDTVEVIDELEAVFRRHYEKQFGPADVS